MLQPSPVPASRSFRVRSNRTWWSPASSDELSSSSGLSPHTLCVIKCFRGTRLGAVKSLPASRAVALLAGFTVWSLRKGLHVTNCRALRRKAVLSRTAIIETAMQKLRCPGYKVTAEHIPNRTVLHGMWGGIHYGVGGVGEPVIESQAEKRENAIQNCRPLCVVTAKLSSPRFTADLRRANSDQTVCVETCKSGQNK